MMLLMLLLMMIPRRYEVSFSLVREWRKGVGEETKIMLRSFTGSAKASFESNAHELNSSCLYLISSSEKHTHTNHKKNVLLSSSLKKTTPTRQLVGCYNLQVGYI